MSASASASSSAAASNPSPVFFFYSLFVLVAGLLAYYLSGFKETAKTAPIVSSAVAAVSLLFSFATSAANSEKTRRVFSKLGAGLLFICACLFAWRASKIAAVPEKNYLFVMFLMLFSGSLMALRYVIFPGKMKKKEKVDKKATAAEQAKAKKSN